MLNRVVRSGVGSLLLVGALQSCGQRDDAASDLNIVGGEEVATDNPVAKTTVALMSFKRDAFGRVISNICSGSLISPIHVLTAAHCVDDYSTDARPLVIFSNKTHEKLDDDKVRVGFSWQKHETYDPRLMTRGISDVPLYDIAVVLLNKPAPEGYLLAEMTDKDEEVTPGESVVVAGFGLTSKKVADQDSTGTLRWTVTSLLDTLPVQQETMNGQVVKKSIVNGGVCGGDSGGPSFVVREDGSGNKFLRLLSVTSRTDRFCQSTGFNTDVRYYRDWISKTADRLLNDAIASSEKTASK